MHVDDLVNGFLFFERHKGETCTANKPQVISWAIYSVSRILPSNKKQIRGLGSTVVVVKTNSAATSALSAKISVPQRVRASVNLLTIATFLTHRRRSTKFQGEFRY